MAGINVILNSSFDAGSANWSVSNIPETTVTFLPGEVEIVRLVAGGSPFITQGALVIGAPYILEASFVVLQGQASWGPIGQTQTVTTPGVKTLVVPSAGNVNFSISASVNNSHIHVNWVSARRMDRSVSEVNYTMRDFDGDKRQFTVPMMTVASAANWTTWQGLIGPISAALVDVLDGNIAERREASAVAEPNNTNSAESSAQTHYRWIVQYKDAVTGDGPYVLGLPTPKVSVEALFLVGTNRHDPAHAAWIALKAALVAGMVNPRTGNAITISEIYLEE